MREFQGLMLRFQILDDLLSPGKAKEVLGKALERADQAIGSEPSGWSLVNRCNTA